MGHPVHILNDTDIVSVLFNQKNHLLFTKFSLILYQPENVRKCFKEQGKLQVIGNFVENQTLWKIDFTGN